MRLTDLLMMPIAALWRQKLRTMLTTLGVVFGAFVLAASLSIGEGVQETIVRESHRSDISRRVDVYPKWEVVASKAETIEVKVEGTMSEARRERLRKPMAEAKRKDDPEQVQAKLDQARLDKLASIPHVVRSVPGAYNFGFAILGEESEVVQMVPVRPDDELRRNRIVAGRYFESPGERGVVLGEYLAYRLGLRNEAAVGGIIGQSIRLEFRGQRSQSGLSVSISKPMMRVTREERAVLDKVQARLPGALESLLPKSEAELLEAAMTPPDLGDPGVYTEVFPILGVIRDATPEEAKKPGDSSYPLNAELVLPYQTATDLYFKSPGGAEQGVNSTVLLVDEEKNVKEVVQEVEKLGVSARAAIEFIDRERFMYLLIFGGMTCVAGVALLVSALGIANTMLMSVLERTREIGIMKAVGADNRHLQLIFLVEAALIGGIGAGIGLLLAWSASFPGDAWVRSMVLRDIKIDLKGSIFVFPTWIGLTVVAFTVLVTTVAALYPARHASRIDPVKALRHE